MRKSYNHILESDKSWMIKKNKKFFQQDYQKKQNNPASISLASTKMLKRLSFSFYGEDIIKQQKQIILDTYDETV